MIGTVCRAGRGRQDQLAGCPPRLTHGGHHANSASHPRPSHPDDRHRRRPRGRPCPRPHGGHGARYRCGSGQRHAQRGHHARLTHGICPDEVLPAGRPEAIVYHASIACAGNGAPPIDQSGARRAVSVAAKRGTMTLGKPAIGREGVIACVSQTTQGRFLHRRLAGQLLPR